MVPRKNSFNAQMFLGPCYPGEMPTQQNRPRSKVRKSTKLPSDGNEKPFWANDDMINIPNILIDRLNPIQDSRLIVLPLPFEGLGPAISNRGIGGDWKSPDPPAHSTGCSLRNQLPFERFLQQAVKQRF